MNFNNLTNVTEELYVGSTVPTFTDGNIPDIYPGFSYTADMYTSYQGLEIAFPALETAPALQLWGNISRFGLYLLSSQRGNESN